MIPILLTLWSITAAPQFEARPIGAAPVTGSIVALDGKQVTLETAHGRVALEAQGLLGISAKQKPPVVRGTPQPEVWVDLVDGSSLAAQQFTSQDGRARITLADSQTVELPDRNVAVVRFGSLRAIADGQWERLLKMKPSSDLLVVLSKETLDYHKGVLHAVGDKTVDFELDGELVPVKRPKVFGLIYRGADEEQAEPLCWITDTDGSRWAVRSMSLPGKLQWTTPSGASVNQALEQVSEIDLSRGKICYLSDLKPESAVYTPYFPLDKELPSRLEFFRLRQDQNLQSKPLRVGGKRFRKGLALHSRTEAVYYLPGRFRRFEAVAGIDDEVRPRGSVHLILRGDDKLLWEATLTGADKEPSRPLDLDVSGVRRLTIVADFTSDLDVGGHVVLGDARVSK